MFSFFIFILSGVAILSLTLAKRFEMKGYKIIVLRAVSRGDEQARNLYHKSLHFYSEGKVRLVFFVRKQLPVRTKMYANRGLSWIQNRFEERFGDVRGSRFIKKEGISEFFKNISEIEKGTGELHEEIYSEPEEILAYRITPASTPEPESEAEPVALSISEEVIVSKPKKARVPRKKREEKIEESLAPEAMTPHAEPVSEPVLVFIPKPRKPRAKKVPVVEVSEY